MADNRSLCPTDLGGPASTDTAPRLAAHLDKLDLAKESPTCDLSVTSGSTLGFSSRTSQLSRKNPSLSSSEESHTGGAEVAGSPRDAEGRMGYTTSPVRGLLDDTTMSCRSTSSELILLRGFDDDENEVFEDNENGVASDVQQRDNVSPKHEQTKNLFALLGRKRVEKDTRWSEAEHDGTISLQMECLGTNSPSAQTLNERLMVSAQELGLSSVDQSIDIGRLEKALEEYKRSAKIVNGGPKSAKSRESTQSGNSRSRESEPPKPPAKTVSEDSSDLEQRTISSSIATFPLLMSEIMSPDQRSKMNQMLGRPSHSSIPAVYSRIRTQDEAQPRSNTHEVGRQKQRGRSPVKRDRKIKTPRKQAETRRERDGCDKKHREKSSKCSEYRDQGSPKRRGRSARPRDESKEQHRVTSGGRDIVCEKPERSRSPAERRHRDKKCRTEGRDRRHSPTKKKERRSDERDRNRSVSTSRSVGKPEQKLRHESKGSGISQTGTPRRGDGHRSHQKLRDRSRSTSTARSSRFHESKGSSIGDSMDSHRCNDSRRSLSRKSRDRSRSTSTRGSRHSKFEKDRSRSTSTRDRSQSSSTRDRSRSSSTRDRSRSSSTRASSRKSSVRSKMASPKRSISPTRAHQSPLRMSTDRNDSFQMRFNASYESLEPNLSFIFRDRSRSRSISRSRQPFDHSGSKFTTETAESSFSKQHSENLAAKESKISRTVGRTPSQVEVDKALADIGVTNEQRLILEKLGLEIKMATSSVGN